jgi:hypothetical protein
LSWIRLTAKTSIKFVSQPSQLMLIILASWVHHEQQSRIEYRQREVAVLKEHIGRKRILLTDEQSRRLAVRRVTPMRGGQREDD